MLNFLGFMLFSTIEGLSIFALSLYVFRFDFKRYFWHSLIIIEIINFQNYLTRAEIESLSYIAPVINLLVSVLFFRTIVRIPILLSFIMTIVGYAGFIVIQSLLLSVLFTIEEAQTDLLKGYIIQLLTGVIVTLIGWLLYRRGSGFTFDFERLRFKWEHALVIVSISIFIILLGLMMYILNVFANLVGFMVALTVFLYYSIRKEADEN
ncbi:hypothetical protein GCM10010916_42010 [Paenibacillus abyssi]|uniref:Uncharacterized protein n=1 Tax=Paenibacillus abyssi TaxID=1340531 RepID=A0A917G3P8_9BACL|nr:hypothetical protein GCM10010916_42010 [Paenibacillus abyssi]